MAEKKGATDEKRHETTQESPRGIEDDLGLGRGAGILVRVISSGKQALDAVMLEMGRMEAGDSVALGVRAQAIFFPLRSSV